MHKKKTAGGHKVFGLRIRREHETAWIDRVEQPEERKPVQASLPTEGEFTPHVVTSGQPAALFQEPPERPRAGPVSPWEPNHRGAPL